MGTSLKSLQKMSHRKFSAPRHGSLAFLPRKRAKSIRGRIRKFPVDVASEAPHLTAFLGYKAGMTHTMRTLDKPGSKAHKKEILESVSIIDTPPMIAVGVVGYVETPRGLRNFTTVWGSEISDEFKRRLYKNWYKSKKKAFTKDAAKMEKANKSLDTELARIAKNCQVVRVICHTQPSLTPLRLKAAHILEVQINGGSSADKVAFAKGLLENPIKVKDVFDESEMIDLLGVTKGRGFKGVVSRWGVSILPRKTHRGARHPARVSFSVARAGQKGFHHRTEVNKKVFRIGEGIHTDADGNLVFNNASTNVDITPKSITPLGGMPHYGHINNDFLLIKGSCPGVKKRPITLRKTIFKSYKKAASEIVELAFIDTSSKSGRGKWQTAEEKAQGMGAFKPKPIYE